jgi:hypothetical protein
VVGEREPHRRVAGFALQDEVEAVAGPSYGNGLRVAAGGVEL